MFKFGKSNNTKPELSIDINTGATIQVDGKTFPLIHRSADMPAKVTAKVTLMAAQDCKGKEVTIVFKAVAKSIVKVTGAATVYHESDHVYKEIPWVMTPKFDASGKKIAAGTYIQEQTVDIHPLWPSSSEHKCGKVQYIFVAQLKKVNEHGFTVTDVETVAKVWVMNSIRPELPELDLVVPRSAQECWNGYLPYSILTPSETVYVGQTLPLNVRVDRFIEGCRYDFQHVVVLAAKFTLIEIRTMRIKAPLSEKAKDMQEICQVHIKDGWAEKVAGWDRTIHMQLPQAPVLSTSLRSRFLDISHKVVVVLTVRNSKAKATESFELNAELSLQLATPRPEIDNTLPVYGTSSTQGDRSNSSNDKYFAALSVSEE